MWYLFQYAGIPVFMQVYQYRFSLNKRRPFSTKSVVQSCFLKKGILRNFAKFTVVKESRVFFLLKLQASGLQLYFTLPVNFAKFLRTPFFMEHLLWLLLLVAVSQTKNEKTCL